MYAFSFGAVVALTPLVRSLAIRWQLYDRPEGVLKPHAKPIPYLGGVAIFAAWLLPVLIWSFGESCRDVQIVLAIVLGAVILLSMGLLDDLKEIRPRYRLLGQAGVAVGLFAAGLQFRAIPQIAVGGITFFSSGSWEFVAAGLLIQIVLIAGASNAINMLDGLDGLCSGVMVIIAAGLLLVATHIGSWAVPQWCAELVGPTYRFNELSMILAMALTAAALGFLLYNFKPATIFLGDAGSNLLGYLAAVLLLLFADKPGQAKWFLAGLMIMGLPIFDTALALVRRIRNKRPVFGGDRSHFYDQLVDRGLSVRWTVVICYGLAILTVLIAASSLALRTRYMVLIYGLIVIAAAVFAMLGGFVKIESGSSELGRKSKGVGKKQDFPAIIGSKRDEVKSLLIMGAGGLARELANAVAELNRLEKTFQVLGFLDDAEQLNGQERLGLPILGAISQLGEYKSGNLLVMPAAGSGYLREKFAHAAEENDVALATVIHPSAIIGAGCCTEPGVYIAAGCVVTVNVHLGQCALVNMGCTVAHDVRIGKYATVHPGARISGEVLVKDYALIGTQAVILNRCVIGKGAIVAMGAVVSHDVGDYTLVAGNPARVVKRLEKPQ